MKQSEKARLGHRMAESSLGKESMAWKSYLS